MWTLVVTVFLSSVLGSLHCAGMCGAFLAIALGESAGSRVYPLAAYHGGRLVTYMALGALAGMAGSVMNLAGGLAGVAEAATVLTGVTLVGFGVVTYLRLRGVAVRAALPGGVQRLANRGYGAAMRLAAMPRAMTLGLLTTLLPCGWLYAFVAVAGGTGSASGGAIAMAAFWAGTLPVMTALGLGVRGAMGRFGARVPGLTCGVLVAMGLVTLTGRAGLSVPGMLSMVRGTSTVSAATTTPPCCRGASE